MVDRVCKWAHERINNADFIVLDTESTNLDGEIVDLAILDAAGTVMFDSLVKPVGRVTEGARAVHHISDEMIAEAPNFAQVWPQVWGLLAGKIVITYNADFDFRMFALSLLANELPTEQLEESESRWHCLMERYRQHIHLRRWQRLDAALQQQRLPASNTHRALADAQAAYSLLTHLAAKVSRVTIRTATDGAETERRRGQHADSTGARGRDGASAKARKLAKRADQ
jgi:DNA polymerase-3 subunit epsilon